MLARRLLQQLARPHLPHALGVPSLRIRSLTAAASSSTLVPVSPFERFAVMVMGGTQYKVAPDDLITVERVADVQVPQI